MTTASATSLNDLHAFAAVARTRNFRRAAVELGVSASALSHSLRGLEARLGVRLLHRTTRSVAPTEAGERLLARLGPALREIADAIEAINDFRDSPTGLLRINAPRAACDWVLAPLVAKFLAQHPGMRVELVDDDSLVDIVATGFDAGVRFGESLQQDMVAVPIGPPQRFIVVAAPDYLARRGTPADPRQLTGHACIRVRFPAGAFYRWEFMRDGERLEVEVDGPLALGDMRLMVQAAEQGLGLAYVYAQYAQEALAAGRLVSVLDDWRPAEAGFFLYYPSHRLVPAGLRAFIALARESLSAR
ncbi:LysR family transcriptional regulator [Corticibacter populi]|uniref:LysR family transcriptional regulator n=1 Tax=Corticibacter populi TaxID=1550736 RepID=A0A3M6QYG7_9BURK|nr:LysR family transcriptional regulator [Corticibacter populi]RMX07971.1 LysR family transcriptional regulator [Corticibacter populi]RZS35213.1 LysR family transcriptional regulator [Corticibacter populi]